MSKNTSQAYPRSHMRSSFSSAVSTSWRSKLGTSAWRLWRPCSPRGTGQPLEPISWWRMRRVWIPEQEKMTYPSARRLHFDGGRPGLFHFYRLPAIYGPAGVGPRSQRGSPLVRLQGRQKDGLRAILASQRPVLASQQPVLAMITAGDRVPEPGRCSYFSTGVAGGLEQRGPPRRAGTGGHLLPNDDTRQVVACPLNKFERHFKPRPTGSNSSGTSGSNDSSEDADHDRFTTKQGS
ncbi:hypothetical protein EYF80_029564 [Liparis tanakae]|uniref:Uncharacterized protein n=1 Tax=Liparis tanakae TaxID=230148 RepID=A0A4Z2H384_9TELE|nr:hypothetical protein EYF80_029564 [Liparis tanakae]